MPNQTFNPSEQDPLRGLPQELNDASMNAMIIDPLSDVLDHRTYLFQTLQFSHRRVRASYSTKLKERSPNSHLTFADFYERIVDYHRALPTRSCSASAHL
jgi:hypothetical protein